MGGLKKFFLKIGKYGNKANFCLVPVLSKVCMLSSKFAGRTWKGVIKTRVD